MMRPKPNALVVIGALLFHCEKGMKAMQGHHQKLRIKVPKLLVVTKMQRNRCHFHIKGNDTASDRDKGSTRPNKRGNHFPRKLVGSLVKYPSKGKKENEPNGDKGDGKEWHITRKALPRELRNNLVYGDEPVGAVLSQLLTLEGKENKEDNKRARMSHALLSFVNEKKKGWDNFIKAETRKKNRFSGEVHGDANRCGKVMRRKASLWRLVRIPSRILVIRLKLKVIKSLMMKKKVSKQCEQGGDKHGHEDREVSELCKKRILMGARCKPLSSSGTLRYDKDGLHLPEIVP